MVIADRIFTEEEFEKFILLPEHGDVMFELIDRRAYPVVSNNSASRIAAYILAMIVVFIEEHDLGYVTGADGGYKVSGQRYIPDVGFISKVRQPQPSNETYNSKAPDLAVEVLSPTDTAANVRIKLTNYLQAGTTVWIVDPDAETVEIYVPHQAGVKLTKDDTISGGNVLPDFQLSVKAILAKK